MIPWTRFDGSPTPAPTAGSPARRRLALRSVLESAADEEAVLIVPQVHAAELAYLPWRSPRRRPHTERPLVAINLLDGQQQLDPEPGDEEA